MAGAMTRLAIEALLSRRQIVGLSTLGIAIGIAAVIVTLLIGRGSAIKVNADVARLGADVITIQPGQSMRGGRGVRIAARPFTPMDIEAIANQIRGLRHIAPVASKPELTVGPASSWTTNVTGTSNAYFAARQWRLSEGRLFSEYELSIGKSSCILGSAVKRQLFGRQQVLGTTIRIRSTSCEVIGVLDSRGQSGGVTDDDNLVAMPLLAFQRRLLGKQDVHAIVVTSAPRVDRARLIWRLERLLAERRGQDPDFTVIDMKQVAAAMSSTSRSLTALMAALASVSLVVGGVGIMNMMLASLSQRSREIGIRLSIGATPQQIKAQFLAEAVLLAVIGGVVGIAAGLTISLAALAWLKLPIAVAVTDAIWPTAVAAMLGIAFGYWPAAKASRLDPIEALRMP